MSGINLLRRYFFRYLTLDLFLSLSSPTELNQEASSVHDEHGRAAYFVDRRAGKLCDRVARADLAVGWQRLTFSFPWVLVPVWRSPGVVKARIDDVFPSDLALLLHPWPGGSLLAFRVSVRDRPPPQEQKLASAPPRQVSGGGGVGGGGTIFLRRQRVGAGAGARQRRVQL